MLYNRKEVRNMCYICDAMRRTGITDLHGYICKDRTKMEEINLEVSLSLETDSMNIISPALNIRAYDPKNGFEYIYREHIWIKYCPFCGQKLIEKMES